MTQEHEQRVTSGFDVAVIGGGAAGLSAAVVLGRARRSVIVIDAGAPRNVPAAGVHGFLSRDGISPGELLETGRKEVEYYGGQVRRGEAERARRTADGFEVTLDDGTTVAARRLLVTTGLVDELPDVPGVRQRWGRDVLQCPYCHGWEVRDEPVGVLGTGPWAVHQALLFRQWTPDVVLFTHTAPALTDEQSEQLAARGIRVVTGTVDSVEVVDDRLTGVRLSDGTVVARRALVVLPRMVAASGVLADLGLGTTADPRGVGEFVAAEPGGRTEVPGLWVAGNVTDLTAQVVTAAAGGTAAGAAINADLVDEDTERAVAAYRERDAAAPEGVPGDDAAEGDHVHPEILFTQEFWDERYRSAERIWSGNANPHLVSTATHLSPGTALDVGSGEGADVIWLAARGWRVTGVDISEVALGRAATQATAAGTEVADRITWQRVDLFTWQPAPRQYDLVSAQFMHLPRTELQALHRRLAAAVRPRGTLLVVGHHPLDTGMGRRHLLDLMFTAEQVVATLDPDDWDITTATPERQAVDPEGRPIVLRDVVVRAVRRH